MMILEHSISKAAELGQESAVIKGQLAHAENATIAAFVMDNDGAWQWAGAYYGIADQPLSTNAQASVVHALQSKIAMIDRQQKLLIKSLGVMVQEDEPTTVVAPLPTIETEKEAA